MEKILFSYILILNLIFILKVNYIIRILIVFSENSQKSQWEINKYIFKINNT